MSGPENLDFTCEMQISAPVRVVWRALVEPEIVGRYHLAPLAHIELRPGGAIRYGTGKAALIAGTIVEAHPGERLSHTFRFGAISHPGVEADADTLVTYDLRAEGGQTVLRLIHSGFAEDNQTRANIAGGWPYILGQLKAEAERTP